MPWWVIYIPVAVAGFQALSTVTKNEYDNKVANFLTKVVNVGSLKRPDGSQWVGNSPPQVEIVEVEREPLDPGDLRW